MDKLPAHLTLFLALFSGVCVSAAWFTARPFETAGAICIGSAVCLIVLVALRVDKALMKKSRRSTDHAKSAASEA